jgi:caa(3)-type oxidase subunit IV
MAHESATTRVSIRTYVWTYAALLMLATLSWVIAGLHVPGAVALGLGIGAIKAVLVLAYFMHLAEEPFSFKLVIAVSAVLVTIFVGLTALDPITRVRESDLSGENGAFKPNP